MRNEVEVARAEQRNDLCILKKKILKILEAHYPQSWFWVKIKDGGSVSKDGGSDSYIVEIKTSLVKTTERVRKAVLYLEEKLRKEGLAMEEFEQLLYLKRLLQKDDMMKQEIKRVLLHNRILEQGKTIDFIIEGFEVGSLLADHFFDEDSSCSWFT
jgi:hypothetical protein